MCTGLSSQVRGAPGRAACPPTKLQPLLSGGLARVGKGMGDASAFGHGTGCLFMLFPLPDAIWFSQVRAKRAVLPPGCEGSRKLGSKRDWLLPLPRETQPCFPSTDDVRSGALGWREGQSLGFVVTLLLKASPQMIHGTKPAGHKMKNEP